MQHNPNLLTNILMARLRAGVPEGAARGRLLLRMHDVTVLSIRELSKIRREGVRQEGPLGELILPPSRLISNFTGQGCA